jgi:hypothetical protein
MTCLRCQRPSNAEAPRWGTRRGFGKGSRVTGPTAPPPGTEADRTSKSSSPASALKR